MIGYSVAEASLRSDIEAHQPGWLLRAAGKTEEARVQGSFKGVTSLWSEIKQVFMRLQGDCKCAYCERKLEAEEYGAVDQDVEHFRPKNRVTEWQPSAALLAAGVRVSPVPPKSAGYFLLAHQILNYAVGCKPCNSTLKADKFPIAGRYCLDGDDPRSLLNLEQPLLLFPVGDWDADPESAIGFNGISPFARATDAVLQKRGLVTIEFFHLDDLAARKNLARDRAVIIQAIFPQLEVLADSTSSATRKRRAADVITTATVASAAHANCARCFKALHEGDPQLAEQFFDAAVEYVKSIS